MSAFAGKYSFDGCPVNDNFPSDLTKILQARGPDNNRTITISPVAMTCCTFHTTPESCFESQPFISAIGALTWDGRLHNRDEVQSIFKLSGETQGDLAFISAAYEKWGEDFLGHVVGDYALCIWDSGNRKLLL